MSLVSESHPSPCSKSESTSQPISQPTSVHKHEYIKSTTPPTPWNSHKGQDTSNMATRMAILTSTNSEQEQSKSRQRSTRSPTVSSTRVRWRQLMEWKSLMTEASEYLRTLAPEEMYAVVGPGNYQDSINLLLRNKLPPSDESTLRPFIDAKYFLLHNLVTDPVGAVHAHAKIYEGAPADFPQAGKCDFLLVHNGRICGVVELKTFWKVTPQTIDEVIDGTAPIDGPHPGRLAIEQTYGYMVHNKHVFGILTTMNGWVFLSRTEYGELFISRMVPCTASNPYHCTVFQLLYYISALAARAPETGERDGRGLEVVMHLADPKRPRPAPMVPGRGSVLPPEKKDDYSCGQTEYLPPVPPFRRHLLEVWADAPQVVFEPWRSGNTLGAKTFLLTLVPNNEVVVAKMWDGYKEVVEERDNEVSIYLHLSSLWDTVVPRLIGSAEIDFFHSLLIERIEGKELCAENIDDEVSNNIKAAFAEIHRLGVIHGDIRKQNIMVKEDKSVVVLDFESSVYHPDLSDDLIRDENEVIQRVLKEVKREKSSSPRPAGKNQE